MFLNRLQKTINEVDVFKIPWQLYYKYSATMFLNRSGFKVPSHLLTRKRQNRSDKDKQAWELIIFSVQAVQDYQSLLSFENIP